MHFYAFLCENVLGKRPAKIRLMYLSTGETIETVPTAQSVRFITTRTTAVWNAVERACSTGEFRPRTSKLCDYCAFQQWCPAFGGDPDAAQAGATAAYEALLASAETIAETARYNEILEALRSQPPPTPAEEPPSSGAPFQKEDPWARPGGIF